MRFDSGPAPPSASSAPTTPRRSSGSCSCSRNAPSANSMHPSCCRPSRLGTSTSTGSSPRKPGPPPDHISTLLDTASGALHLARPQDTSFRLVVECRCGASAACRSMSPRRSLALHEGRLPPPLADQLRLLEHGQLRRCANRLTGPVSNSSFVATADPPMLPPIAYTFPLPRTTAAAARK